VPDHLDGAKELLALELRVEPSKPTVSNRGPPPAVEDQSALAAGLAERLDVLGVTGKME
jgi:hypothetical protein